MMKTTFLVISLIVDIIFIIIISFTFYIKQPIKTDSIIYIPKGSINQIISYLRSKNLPVTKIDSYILRTLGNPQTGYIDLEKKNFTKIDFLYKLTIAKSTNIDITLIPGESIYFFLQQASKKLNLSFEKLYKEYKKQSPLIDGFILANTYKIPIYMTEKKLIKYLINNSLKEHMKLSKEFLGKFDFKSWKRYLIIASIIQKEAKDRSEMPLVSAVIYNRLKRKMRLQMDGTLNYGIYSHIRVTPKRIKEDNSIYNTYKIKALPLSPVASVSRDSIYFAINPANVNYLYFVKGKDGYHKFSKSYKSHLRNIKYRNR